ncbi:MAG TPA: hypothetical protein VLS93_14685 [Anaeromyxobacteraceae bacterium]|nr:hypothetical protein [Anaeromyxobacteraceae bacterium]
MRKTVPFLALAALLSAPAAASAQLQLGVRFGLALPSGDLEAEAPVGDLVDRALPVGLEVGWRFFDHLTVGIHGQYAFGTVDAALQRDCDLFGSTCSVSAIRAGIHARWALRPDAGIDPWFGLGMGYEWLRNTVKNGPLEATLAYRGFEWARAEVGLDVHLGRFAVGPWLSFGMGLFTHRTLDLPDTSVTEKVANDAAHGWFEGGVRVLFTL